MQNSTQSKEGAKNLSVTSDDSGFAAFYGLLSSETVYTGNIETTYEQANPLPESSTLTGSVDVTDLNDAAFFGQTAGTITFSNGASITISASDSRSDVIQKLNNAGLTAAIDENGHITITAKDTADLKITSDNTGFSGFYGLGEQEMSVTGSVSTSTESKEIIVDVHTIMQGSQTSLTGGEYVLGGTIKIGSGAVIDATGKTLQMIVNELNAQGQTGITVSITDGRFTITSETGEVAISATGDLARVTGLDDYVVDKVTADDADITLITRYTGSNSALTGNETVTGGSIKVGNGALINTKGKTLQQIANEINAQNLSGITATITDGKFTIDSKNGSVSIAVSGDFARVTGMGDYTVSKADTTTTPSTQEKVYTVYGSTENLTGSETALSGSIQINGSTIDATNKTLNQIITEINALGLAGITAEISSTGRFYIKSENGSPTVTATGDFARISGLADYTVEVAEITSNVSIPEGYIAITTAEDLFNIRNNLNGKYILMNDIDLSGYDNFVPIGFDTDEFSANYISPGYTPEAFTGILDGNGHTISNLKITDTERSIENIGLFSTLDGAEVKNLTIENAVVETTYCTCTGVLASEAINSVISDVNIVNSAVTGRSSTGLLIGSAKDNTKITNAHTSGTVTNTSMYAGGLVGLLNNSSIDSSSSDAIVNGSLIVGGLVGVAETQSYISNSYATGDVTTTRDYQAGGFIGCMLTGTIVVNSYATGNVTGTEQTGGFAGQIAGAQVSNSYSTGNVSGTSEVGGFAGRSHGAVIQNSYAAGTVTATEGTAGGFVGYINKSTATLKNSTITNSFWNKNTSGFSTGIGLDESPASTISLNGLTTSQMGQSSVFTNAGWDEDIWDFSGAMPTLKPQSASGSSPDSTSSVSFISTVDRISESEAIAQGYTIIKTAQDLDNIRNNLSGKYILMADIDLSSYSNWTAIGDSTNGFTGELNGNGYVIKNLTINRADEDYVGLFAVIGDNSGTTGEVKNLGLENVNITGSTYVAGLTGTNWGTITNCYVTGNVNGNGYLGGLAGTTAGTITHGCSASNVSGGEYQGSLAGHNSGNISNSYAIGDVLDGNHESGGLVGENSGNISNCYATGDVDGYKYSGGLVGYNTVNGTISNCYALGEAIASSDRGGLAGSNWNTITNSIWNSELNDIAIGDSTYGSDSNLKGLTTTEMQNPDNWAGWDTGVWDFSTYPPTIKDQNASSGSGGGAGTVITGSVNAGGMVDRAFWGQKNGVLTFSDGTEVNISASDTRSQVLEKINAAGISAEIDENGNITLSGGVDLSITSDTSGFADFYGLDSEKTTYTGTQYNSYYTTGNPGKTTITGSVDITGLSGGAFYGQKDGVITFSNGETVEVSSTNTFMQVYWKMENKAGRLSIIDGKITIIGEPGIHIVSDTSGFSQYYGLMSTDTTYSGEIKVEEVLVAASGSNTYQGDFITPINRLTEEQAIAQGYTVIKTADDLNNIRNNLSGKYMLMNDIDLSGINWDSIGAGNFNDTSNAFAGVLDGNGYVIKNLKVNTTDTAAGLFGAVSESGAIRNLGVIDADVSGYGYAGIIAGTALGEISNVYTSGDVNVIACTEDNDYFSIYGDMKANVGGIAGVATNVTSAYSSANIRGTGEYVVAGGLIGMFAAGALSKSYSTGNIENVYSAGGIVGFNYAGTVSEVFTSGSISATDTAGGIVGVGFGYISDSYSIASVHSENKAGGIAGAAGFSITNSYAAGTVSGVTAGGIVGCENNLSLDILNSFWDIDKTGQTEGYQADQNGSLPTVTNVEGMTTSEFANAQTFIDAGWSEDIWDFSGSAPTLKFMNTASSGGSTGGGSADTFTSSLTGSVDADSLADRAFWGQKDGVLTIHVEGPTGNRDVNINISASDTRSQVLQKLNNAGLTAELDADGRIKISSDNALSLEITSDTSGFADFYGLSETGITYSGFTTTTADDILTPATSTLTGGVDVRDYLDRAFWGQKDGVLKFTNGMSINISADDNRADVLSKLNAIEGVTAIINTDGKIQITAENAQDLMVESDTSGFADFYGLSTTGGIYDGGINSTDITVDGGESTLTGSVNTFELSGDAFWGQNSGTITFSNGASVNIDAEDNLITVLQKLNDAGFRALINTDGKIEITAQGVSDLTVTGDSSGFANFYGLKTESTLYEGTQSQETEIADAGAATSSTLTGSVDTGTYSGDAFYGQQTGSITFSNGTTVNINATDTLADVLQKMNDAGLVASINSNGQIQITANGTLNLSVTSDNTGFSAVYGLGSSQVFNPGSITTDTEIIKGAQGDASSSTITGSVDTRDFADAPFWGQKDGTINFSNGISVAISSTDTVSQVLAKMNAAGLQATINSDGKITITAENTENLNVISDTSGFADFYGISVYGGAYTGSITTTGLVTPTRQMRTYSVQSTGGTTSDGENIGQTFSKLTGTNNVTANTQILESIITISYKNDAGVDTSKTYTLKAGTLQSAMDTINNSNWYVKAQITEDGKFELISRAVGPFDIKISMEKVDGVAGDFGRVVGMATQTTLNGDPSQERKDPATITGGTSGLTLTDQIVGENSITIWMTRERPGFTGVDTMTGTGDLASVSQTITFRDSNGDGKITIAEAIDQINEKASTTKVKASLINGQFVLTQIDDQNADDKAKYNTNGGANTAGEGDTIKYTIQGTGDFEHITGLDAYSVAASTANTEKGDDNGYHYHAVVSSTVKNDGGTIKSGSVNLNGTIVDVSGLTVQGVIDKINNNYSSVATAGWDNGKLVIMLKSQSSSASSATSAAASVTATGDASRVLGLAGYSISSGDVTAGVYKNHWNYSYDVWSQKTDDWDLSKDYSGSDSYNYSTSLEYGTTYEYRYQDEVWTSRTWGPSLSNQNPSGDRYRNQSYSSSVETNKTVHTTGTSYGTSVKTSSSITGYKTSVEVSGSGGYWSTYQTHTVVYPFGGNFYTSIYTTSTWISGDLKTVTHTTGTNWSTSYQTITTSTTYLTSNETNYTTWYSGSYQERTQDSAWESRDTGYGNTISDSSDRVRNENVYSRTWYYETYWTKDYSTNYDTNVQEGYYNAPGFKYSVGQTYRNVSSTHVVDQYTNGKIEASTSYNSSTFNTHFGGQQGGTITINSSYFGNIASFSYSSTTSINSILQSLRNSTGIESVSSDGTTIVTDGYYGKVTISDTGNAAKLLGIATSGTNGSANRTNKSDDDWNGITKKTDTLTGSRTDLYDDFSFALQEGGSFDLYLGDRLLKTITYAAGSTVEYILNQMQGTYVYDTGKYITDPFSDKLYDEEEYDLYGTAYTDSSGRIYYTASYSAKLDSQGRIVITSDVYNSAQSETISVKNDTGNFTHLAGLTSNGHNYAENNDPVIESYGYDRLTGSVKNLTKGHLLGNLKAETFQITGGNGTFNVSIDSTDTIQDIINEIFSQTNGAYKADLDEDGRFYIESTIQTPTDTQVTATDLTERLGLVAADRSTGPASQTETGDQGYFVFETDGGGVYGMKPNSIFTGLKDGQLTFTLHARESTGETGSITYRPDITYTIDIVYNDTVTSVLNKMKQAILAGEDDIWEHDDVTDENRADRIDFHVNYDETNNLGKIYLQIIGNYASAITFDNDTSGFVEMAGLSKDVTIYDANYTSESRGPGKSQLTGSVSNLSANHIFGSMTAGSMTISAGSTTKTIDVLSTDRIQDVIDKINEGGIFEAGLDNLNRFWIKTVGQNANDITISGTTDFYNLVGLKGNTWTYNTTTELGSLGYSKITGSVFGLTTDRTFNNMTSGSFSINADGHRTLNVDVEQGVTSVGDVIDFINNSADSDFTASLDDSGRIVISTKIDNGATIYINDGTTDYAKILGLTAGTLGGNAVGVNGANDIYATLTGSTTGLDNSMRFSAGDFIISVTNPDGQKLSQTFTLTGNETLADISSMISNSNLGISAVMDASTNSLSLRSKNAGNYIIEVTDGTSDFAETVGFTRNGAQANPSQIGSLSTLTSNSTVHSAQTLGFSAGDFFINLVNTDGSISDSLRIEISQYDTIDSIISKINNSDFGVAATINADGKMVLTRTETTTAGGISVTKGTSDFTNKIGFTSGGNLGTGAQIENGVDAERTVITSNEIAVANPTVSLSTIGITAGNFKINGANINVTENDSIATLLGKINAAFSTSDPNGVYAEFINDRIVLTSNSASGDARINIEAGTTNLTDMIGWTSGSNIVQNSQTLGDNAIFTLNGQEFETQSNIVSLDKHGNLVDTDSSAEAIRLTLKATGSGTIDIGKNSVTTAFNKLNTFVKRFNEAMGLSQNKVFEDDASFEALIVNIKKALTDNVGTYRQIQRQMSDIGINVAISGGTSSSDGRVTISLNKDKFINAFMNDPDKVKGILIGNDKKPINHSEAGTFTRLRETLDESLQTNGYFASTSRLLEATNKSLLNEITLNTNELNNVKASMAFEQNSLGANQAELADFLAQLEEQYEAVNNMIDKLKYQYNQSLTRLVLNPGGNTLLNG